MALSAFDDKTRPPALAQLRKTLGGSFGAWSALRKIIRSRFGPVSEEWGYTSKSTGWGLRLKQPARTILYMTPCHDHFLVSFVLGEKAVTAAQKADLPASILDNINSAKKYAEGRGVRIEVSSENELESIEQLAIIKMSN